MRGTCNTMIFWLLMHASLDRVHAMGGGGGEPPADACDDAGGSAEYVESIGGASRRIVSSGCPNHPITRLNPNYGRLRNLDFEVPAVPQYDEGAERGLELTGGTVGVTINGGLIFSAYFGGNVLPTRERNAVSEESRTFDYCSGHSNGGGNYHYHSVPTCVIAQLEGADHQPDDPSPLVGWMYDGFPVMGPIGPQGVRMMRCTEQGAHPTYCLDECNGFYGNLDSDEYTYRYYFSGPGSDLSSIPVDPVPGSEYFPHAPFCLRGCCPPGQSCHNLVNPCTASARPGTAEGFVARPTAGLVEPWAPSTADRHRAKANVLRFRLPNDGAAAAAAAAAASGGSTAAAAGDASEGGAGLSLVWGGLVIGGLGVIGGVVKKYRSLRPSRAAYRPVPTSVGEPRV